MKLRRLRICNFQSFGPDVTPIELEDLTYLIGPCGAGKTAVLQALSRLFDFDPAARRVRKSDFHVPVGEKDIPAKRTFYIEADFVFPELGTAGEEHPTIPPHFAHMRLDDGESSPRVRVRLDAQMDESGDIEDILSYVLDVDTNGAPLNKHPVARAERNNIHVHYLPARRDPSGHISYTANSLLGRALRSGNWHEERSEIKGFTTDISACLAANSAVQGLSKQLKAKWQSLHKGAFFTDPRLTFADSELEALLRHLSLSFAPGHGEQLVDFSRLSDGQKSMLYVAVVLAMQNVGRAVLKGEDQSFDVEKLKPAVFTLIAMEEPENSLSPHYLGRVAQSLADLGMQDDAQAIIATHAPSMLKRISPDSIRYLRLDGSRRTVISRIMMPSETDEAYKFVREAVQAFPELYFSRLVILGEGDSEEIVLPRLIKAKGVIADEAAISVVPLGGRHVNHFWRLLTALNIPFLTLLDLDRGRYQGGWGRIRYVADQLRTFVPVCGIEQKHVDALPAWNVDPKDRKNESLKKWLSFLESKGIFFSSPLDLDFAVLSSFPNAFGISDADKVIPSEDNIKAVLGKSHHDVEQYSKDQQKLFAAYHSIFKLGSKPVAHINALSKLTDDELVAGISESLGRLAGSVLSTIGGLPE